MKTLISSFLLIVLISCGSTKSKPINSEETTPVKTSVSATKEVAVGDEDDAVADEKLNGFSNEKRMGDLMNFLASDELQGRDTGSEGIAKAASFIEKIFKNNNIQPYFVSYKDTLTNFPETAYNIVGMVEGNDPKLKNEYIIIGAHYDHIGRVAGNPADDIANGANDNATGTSTVLELARYFGNAKTNKRTLLFALFSAEEKGLLGSKHLAEKLKAQNFNLYTMLNFEMTGVPLVDKDYKMYLTGYEKSNLADVVNEYANENFAGFLPKAKEFSLFMRSDNYPFHNTFNVPSQTFSTFDFTNFDHYHGVDDEAELMNFSHMAELVNDLIAIIEGIADAPTQEIKYN